MNQHLAQQLRQYVNDCRREGRDPLAGDSELASALREILPTQGAPASWASAYVKGALSGSPEYGYGPGYQAYKGPAETEEMVRRHGLDDPAVQVMSYSERREAGKPVCRRNRTGRCMECGHTGPCQYSTAFGGTRVAGVDYKTSGKPYGFAYEPGGSADSRSVLTWEDDVWWEAKTRANRYGEPWVVGADSGNSQSAVFPERLAGDPFWRNYMYRTPLAVDPGTERWRPVGRANEQ